MTALNTFMCPPPHRLRVLEGPLQGTIHLLTGRFRIGRSRWAELQLFDDRVSGEHAEIVIDPNGRFWLFDLDSTHGTYVGDQRIRQIPLQLNTIFRIAGNRFVFEEELPLVGELETFVTAQQRATNRCDTMELDTSLIKVLPPEQAKALSDVPEGMVRATGTYANGTAYPGNPVEDIAEYRDLELRMLRNELRSTFELDRFETLTERLCHPAQFGRRCDLPRAYNRIGCDFPAALRRASGRSQSVTMVDLGADGARVVAHGHRIVRGEELWLTVDLVTGPRTCTRVFTAQVVSVEGGRIGLSFADRRRQPPPTRTLQHFDERVSYAPHEGLEVESAAHF